MKIEVNRFIEMLSHLSLYEIFRIRTFIDQFLTEPEALQKIQERLVSQQSVNYFDPRTNQEIEAIVVKMNRTYAWLQNTHDHATWKIPFYMINSEKLPISFPKRVGIDRINLKVGESVGFTTRFQETYYGEVYRLNPKSATVKLKSGQMWRVGYKLLFLVQEAQVIKDPFLPNSKEMVQDSPAEAGFFIA